MTKKDIDDFIRIMKEVCEDWTPEEVEAEYGDCATLKEAVYRKLNKINAFYDYVEEVIRPDAEARGLWKKEDKNGPWLS